MSIYKEKKLFNKKFKFINNNDQTFRRRKNKYQRKRKPIK